MQSKTSRNAVTRCQTIQFQPIASVQVQRINFVCAAKREVNLYQFSRYSAQLSLLGSLPATIAIKPAFAAEPDLGTAQQAAAATASDFGQAAVQAAGDLTNSPENIVISILFTTAIAALTVVTLGVRRFLCAALAAR